MSIFQSKEWWSTKVGDNEEFDPYHMTIANIDNEDNNSQKILLGSFNGFLRIYQPSKRSYKVEDLLFETNLGGPIVQIAAGNFVSGTKDIFLAVLFFKKLTIFNFTNNAKQGMQSKIISEAQLTRNACNMVVGGFGGTKNKDLICIQSIDGMLMVYEQEKPVCMCQLDDFILPGPISYHPLIDCFILQNSNLEIECYKYSSIGAIFNNSQKEKKILQPEWAFNAGETATDIICYKRNEKLHDLIVLTEKMIFILTQKGTVKAQKKLDFIPLSICAYTNPDTKPIGSGEDAVRPLTLLIASASHHLLVYQDFHLIWAAKTNYISHAIRVTTFGNTRGLITTLNDNGWIEVSYLGTTPPKAAIGGEEKKEIDFAKAHQDYISTLTQIDQRENQKPSEPAEKLTVHCQLTSFVTQGGYVENAQKYFRDDNGSVISVKFRVTLSYSGLKAENVTVYFNLPENLHMAENPIVIDELKGQASTPYSFDVLMSCLSSRYPYQNEFGIHVSFYNSGGKSGNLRDPRTAFHSCKIPMPLQAKTTDPIKNANFKITVQGSDEIPGLKDIFDDFYKIDPNASENLSNPNVASFLLGNGVDCTLLLAKNSNKYRLQSSQFEGLYYVTSMFIQRVCELKSDFKFTFADALPLQDLFVLIDQHSMFRTNISTEKQELDQKANEFRVIEKRMLTRFKDRNPTPMNNMDILLQKSYQDIMEAGNRIEELQEKLADSSQKLSVAIQLIMLLLEKRFSLPDAFIKELKGYISSEVGSEDTEIGWEEITYHNLSYLAKFMTSKGDMSDYKPSNIQRLDDIGKLKKSITTIFDKIAKYGQNLPLPGKVEKK